MLCLIAPACATKAPSPPAPAAVVVTVKDRPPAELLRCPDRPRRPASTAGGVLPEDKRRALAQLAAAYDQAFDQLVRLIEWNEPGACGAINPAPAPPTSPSAPR
jgi:hypothetical protein